MAAAAPRLNEGSSASSTITPRSEDQERQDPRPSQIFDRALEHHRIGDQRRKSLKFSESSSMIETEGFNRADSDETTSQSEIPGSKKGFRPEKGHQFTVPESSALTKVNLTPHMAKRLQQDLVEMKERDSKLSEFVRKYFPESGSCTLNEDQLIQLEALSKARIKATEQFSFDVNMLHAQKEYIEKNKGKIPFFLYHKDSLPRDVAEKIRRYLNKTIVLDHKMPLHDAKAQGLINPQFLKPAEKAGKESSQRGGSAAKAARMSKSLHLMILYKEALRYLCAKLKGDDAVLNSIGGLVNREHIDDIIKELKRILKKEQEVDALLRDIAEEITVLYIEGFFQQFVLDGAADKFLRFLEAIQKDEERAVTYRYEAICSGMLHSFQTEKNRPLAIESGRAVTGGIITFLGKGGEVILPPFKAPPADPKELADTAKRDAYEKQVEGLVQKYIVACQKLVGRKVFHDKTVVLKFSEFLPEIANLKRKGSASESGMEAQERIFNFLMTLEDDDALQKDFQRFMNEKLAVSNPECMERLREKGHDCMTIRKYLLYFYRAPFQTFLNSPSQLLMEIDGRIFKNIYKTSIFENLKDWKDDETKKIMIGFDEEVVSFQFMRKFAIGKASQNPAGVLVQDLTIMVPRPRKYDIALGEPVRLRFYCEVRKNLSPDEQAELDVNLERISFSLKVLKFPPLEKQIIEVDEESGSGRSEDR